MTCGIYRITHRATGRHYVGQSVNIERRWRAHRSSAQCDQLMYVSRALHKYGADAFDFVVIQVCEQTTTDLATAEIHWIAELGSMRPTGFNDTSGGGSETKFTAEVLAKMSARKKEFWAKEGSEFRVKRSAEMRALWADPIWVAKHAELQRGYTMPEAAKAKISAARMGRKVTPETIENMRAAQQKRVADGNHNFAGKPRTDEAKAKISKATKGRPGKPLSPETRAKIGAAQRAFHAAQKLKTRTAD